MIVLDDLDESVILRNLNLRYSRDLIYVSFIIIFKFSIFFYI